MKPTRRCHTAASLVLALAGWAALVADPVVLVGAAGITGLVLAAQVTFVATIARATVTADVEPARTHVTAREMVPIVVSVRAVDAPFDLTVTPTLPASAEGDPDSFTLDPEQDSGETTFQLTFPVAGTVTLPGPAVVATDPLGLFEQPITTNASAAVTVDPRAPRNVHVGAGGEPIAAAFGEHESGRIGAGLEPAEIRRYVPGEAVRRMDWKATARRGEPYVREFEVETDRVTALVLDHRSSMAAGTPDETKFDHGREVALAFADSARALGDPLGCYSVGTDGLTASFDPDTGQSRQLVIRRHLYALEPETSSKTSGGRKEPFDPVIARRKATLLGEDVFGSTLRPFLEGPRAYVKRVDDRPLYAAVQGITARQRGTLWTVIITDDENRTELHEAVRLARSSDGRVIVFLTPSVLFEPEGLVDLETAYERYRDFEEFRRSLAATERVEAFEVAPGERLATLLSASSDAGRSRGWA